jgi:HEAT repeat protein
VAVSFLDALWQVSLAMMAMSLSIVLLLIAYRWIDARNDRHRRRRRGQIEAAIFAFLDGSADRDAVVNAAGPRVELVGEVGLELVDLVRGQDRDRLIALLDGLGVARALRRRVEHGRRLARMTAAERLRCFGDEETSAVLRRALEDRDPDVRLAAARSLAEIGALPPLAELVAKLQIGTVQHSQALRHVFRSLGRHHSAELIALLESDAPALAKVLALDALGRSGDYTAIAAIVAASADADIELRAAAFRALGDLGHPAALPAVSRGLADPDWEIRTQAAVCAGRIGFVSLLPKLVALLGDPVWWVRFRSIEALFALGEPGEHAVIAVSQGAPGPAARTAQLVLAERGTRC